MKQHTSTLAEGDDFPRLFRDLLRYFRKSPAMFDSYRDAFICSRDPKHQDLDFSRRIALTISVIL